jgi:hypothetical protein
LLERRKRSTLEWREHPWWRSLKAKSRLTGEGWVLQDRLLKPTTPPTRISSFPPPPSSPTICHLTLLLNLLKGRLVTAAPLRRREAYLTRNQERSTLISGVTVLDGEGEQVDKLPLHPDQAAVWRNPRFGRGRRKPQLPI